MILKELRLRNIRTYEHDTIEFPNGIMLFEGGIGSGKSTILLAIEFALFGLGEERGNTLLTLGKNEGEVELAFEVNGKRHIVHRKLVRAKRGAGARSGAHVPGAVAQDDCWIEHDGVVDRLSARDMKIRVLSVLGFNEQADPRAKSSIFRYTIYTPQEEMKGILADQERRLQTIRKALRLEDYKVAGDNAHKVAMQLRGTAGLLIERGGEAEAIDAEIRRAEEGLPKIRAEAAGIEEEIAEAEIEVKGAKSESERLSAELERLAGDAKKAKEVRADIERTVRSIESLRAEVRAGEGRLKAAEGQLGQLQAVKEPSLTRDDAEDMLKDARRRLSECQRGAGVHEHDLSNYSRLVREGKCPTCGQPTDGEFFTSRLEGARARVEESNALRGELEKEIDELEAAVRAIRDYEEAAARRQQLNDRVEEIKDRLAAAGEQLLGLEAQLEELKRRGERSERAEQDYSAVRMEYEANEERLERAEGREKELIKRRAALGGEVSRLEFEIGRLTKERERALAERARGEALLEVSDWLDGYFASAIEKIERSIMTSANRDFDAEFARWFAYLVEDPTKSVRVDEDFTPLISQDSYEQEIGNLSGGERTALALAYRLALNKVVQKNTDVDASLLILDEPTDGFSKDQIAKMGDLLKDLNIRQGIIVSHERELEGAVDHIFRVSKEAGRSRVTPTPAKG